jgi:hypothetical protein
MMTSMSLVRTPHSADVVAMGEAAFDQLSAPSQQALAVVALDPPPVGVHRPLLAGLTFPFALPLLLPLRNVAAHLVLRYSLQHRAGVSLVSHHLLDALDVDLWLGVRVQCGLASGQLRDRFAGFAQRPVTAVGVGCFSTCSQNR